MKLSRLFLFIAGLLLALPAAHAGFLLLFNGQGGGGGGGGGGGAFKTVFITSGTTWNVPNDFTSTNTFVAIGGGAGGGGGNSGQGGGGGGGAFATIGNLALTPGSAIPIQIGQGGAGATNVINAVAGNGTDTIFNTTTLIAKGGAAGVFLGGSGPRGGAGGAAASSTPAAGAHSGGKGADIPSAATGGGGGGAAGGADGNGGAGGTISSSSSSQGGSGGGGSDGGSVGGGVTASLNGGAGGTAFDATAGGAGGTGGASPTAGSAGSHGSGGGGGGGSSTASVTTATGGVGGAGLNYTQTVDSSQAGPGGGGGGAGGDSGATSVGAVGAAGGLYGGGGGTGGLGTTTNGAGGAGKNGILIITYQSSGGGAGGATTYFVDSVAGNDSNNGLTQALAWKTVTPVNAKVYNAGDSVLFNGGQTFTGPITLTAAANYSGTTPPTLAQPLTIGSYGAGRATINITTATYALNLNDIHDMVVQNLIITGSSTSLAVGLKNNANTTQYSNFNFSNLDISGVKNGFDIESRGGDIAHGFSNVTLNGINIHNLAAVASPGIFLGAWTGSQYNITSATYAFTNITINNSTISGAGSDGVDMWNTNGFLFTNTRITGNGTTSTGGTAAIETQASTNGVISFTELDHAILAPGATFDSDGLNIDRGSSNIIAEYNWVHDNAGAGITVFQGAAGTIAMSGITVRYNITQNNGTAGASTNVPTEIVLGSSGQIAITGINVYNNTFYASKNASNVNSIVLFEAANITGTFKNNILYGTANPRSVDAVTFNPSTMAFLGNDYFGTTKFRWNNVSYTTVAAWATATSQDASALTSDPTLTSPGTGGTTNGYNPGSLGAYKLIGGSPMIGVGQVIASPGSQDYYGLTIPTTTGTGYNVGADGSSPAAAVPSAPTISSPLTGATVTTQVATLSGTGINGDTINVTLDGATSLNVATVASGVWSYNTPSLTNASHTVTATQTNGTGTSVASNSVTFTTSFSSGATPSTLLHYAAGDGQGILGFNLADVSSVNGLNALPAGYKGLVFIGTCAGADSTFQAFVNPFNGNTKLWGFYIVDEPLVGSCTTANLKAEVDYIHANMVGVKTFVVLENLGTPTNPDYTGYVTPANTDLDYVGIDPYPVRTQFTGGINLSVIGAGITAAQVPGWTIAQMVPVYQAFGNYQCTGAGPSSDWNIPTASQEQSILVTFGNFMPTPVFDYAYAWGQQCAPPNGAVGDDVISTTGYLQTFYQQRNGVPVTPTIQSPAVGSTVSTTQATISGTGAVSGDTIIVCVDGSLVAAGCSGGSGGGTATVNASLNWSFNTSPLPNSQHFVVAAESNTAGASLNSNTVNFTTNVVVITTDQWDPAKTNADFTLSGTPPLTSTVTATSLNFPHTESSSGKTTGKLHFEETMGPIGNINTRVGIANASHSFAGAVNLGEDTNSIGAAQGGVFYNNAVAGFAALTETSNDVLAVEVDLGAGLYWVKNVTQNTAWNGNSANDPGAGTGGIAFSTAGSPTWFVANVPTATLQRSQTINFGAGNFTTQCSTNFLPWNGSLTACPAAPPPGSSGTGLSAAVSLLPSDLPTTHWHTPPRPWAPANIPASSYLTRMNNLTAYYLSHVSGSTGCFDGTLDPYDPGAIVDTPNGYVEIPVAVQLKTGDRTNQAKGILAMTCSTSGYLNNTGGPPDFNFGPLNVALPLFTQFASPAVPDATVTAWKNNLSIYRGVGSNTNNWGIYDMWGAWESGKNGISAFSPPATSANGTPGIECMWLGQSCSFNTFGFNQTTRFANPPFGLYDDQAPFPTSLSVERQSTPLLAIIADGYNGASAAAMKTATALAAHTGLLMQGVDGSNAAGGRVTGQTWVDGARQVTDEIMAQQLNLSDPFLAGQYQHAAELTFSQLAKYQNPQCCSGASFFLTKNHYNPTLDIGYQNTPDYMIHGGQLNYFTALSYLNRIASVVTEQPAPFEIGGYAFTLSDDFKQVAMNAGGTAIQVSLAGQTTLTTFNIPMLWSAAGIMRIGRVGWETRLGPQDAGFIGGLGNQVTFGPTWITSGTSWTRLAQNPSTCGGTFSTTFANPAVTFGKVIWTCSGGPTFTQNLTVTLDGVLSQTTCAGCPSTWGMTYPLLINDGTGGSGFNQTTMTTSINTGGNGIVSTTWPSIGDSQNFMTISGNATTTFNEATRQTVTGDVIPVRTFTSDATQTTFVYPAKTGEPSAASVRSGMTITGTNTYTNSALSSSVVSSTNGTYYIGKQAAGGWATTLTLPGGTMTFNNPCNFIAQLNGSGQVTTLEVDRNVTATTIPGSLGTHTNVSLTANTPIHNQ